MCMYSYGCKLPMVQHMHMYMHMCMYMLYFWARRARTAAAERSPLGPSNASNHFSHDVLPPAGRPDGFIPVKQASGGWVQVRKLIVYTSPPRVQLCQPTSPAACKDLRPRPPAAVRPPLSKSSPPIIPQPNQSEFAALASSFERGLLFACRLVKLCDLLILHHLELLIGVRLHVLHHCGLSRRSSGCARDACLRRGERFRAWPSCFFMLTRDTRSPLAPAARQLSCRCAKSRNYVP